MLTKYNQEFLLPEETNFSVFIDKLKLFQSKRINTNNAKQSKAKTSNSTYIDQQCFLENGKDTNTVYNELQAMFDGALRPHSTNACFNMVPTPLLDGVVASTYTQLYNCNSISTPFAGNILLFEQAVAKAIGKLIGWENASGIACSGGKATLLYALKTAISRAAPDSLLNGIPPNLVVIAQESSHYSLEHVCALLGLGSNNIIRIPAYKNWEMDPQKLAKTIKEVISSGKKVAAIFCCGGTTINFACDNSKAIFDVINTIYSKPENGPRPYLHLDSVIGWLWFTFLTYQGNFQQYTTNPLIIQAIQEITEKFAAIKYFDSFGVDFHKNGLCPYSSSMFIAKTSESLLGLTDGKNQMTDLNNSSDNISAFKYTLENTRPASGIAAAYTVLNRLGKNGFRNYLVTLLTIKHNLLLELAKSPFITIANHHSAGWEIVFDIDFGNTTLSHEILANSFISYVWEKVDAGCPQTPFLSIIPNYQQTPITPAKTMFLCYSMSLLLHQDIIPFSQNIIQLIVDFRAYLKSNPNALIKQLEQPIK